MINTHKGFTMIELMVVVVIIGILASFVAPKIISRPEQAREVKVKQEILAIQNALELYKLDNGFFPTEAQGLEALVKKPDTEPEPKFWQGYLKKLPKDPWGEYYQYKNPGENQEIDIFSYGPVKTDENVIGNWNIE